MGSIGHVAPELDLIERELETDVYREMQPTEIAGRGDNLAKVDEDSQVEVSAEEANNGNEDIKSKYSTSGSRYSHEAPSLCLNYDAIKHVATYFLPGAHGACINITGLTRGTFHEVHVLHFEDGWSCIGRFTRDFEMLRKTESELATMDYVRKHTTIPVPEIFFVNHNENHVAGAAFVLIERMAGEMLCNLWDDLSLEHKHSVMGCYADVLGQLADLKFDKIGSLQADGTLGPLLNMTNEWQTMGEDAFSTTTDYFCSFLKEDNFARSEDARALYPAIKDELRAFLEQNATNPTLHDPYRLKHADLNNANILISFKDDTLEPYISAVIDWDWSHTSPLYFLYEYPYMLRDHFQHQEEFADNKMLRKHFVATLIERLPEGSIERKHVKQCFREKTFILSEFERLFMRVAWETQVQGMMTKGYLSRIRGEGDSWDRLPYEMLLDWKPDTDLEDSDLEADQKSSEESSGVADSDNVSDSELE